MGAAKETVRVDIVTKDHGFLGPDVTGLVGPIQAARVIVTAGQDSESHVVGWSADSAIQLPDDQAVANLFPSDIVSCTRSAVGIGPETTLSCLRSDERTLFAAAAAAATIKRSWGWDESPTILVRFAAGTSFVVDPVFEGG